MTTDRGSTSLPSYQSTSFRTNAFAHNHNLPHSTHPPILPLSIHPPFSSPIPTPIPTHPHPPIHPLPHPHKQQILPRLHHLALPHQHLLHYATHEVLARRDPNLQFHGFEHRDGLGGTGEVGTFVDVEAPEVGVVGGREGVDLGVCLGRGMLGGMGWKRAGGGVDIPLSNSSTWSTGILPAALSRVHWVRRSASSWSYIMHTFDSSLWVSFREGL